MTASGTAGHGAELGAYFDLSRLGAVVVKSLSAEPWPGNPAPRLLPVAAGMLNSVGLQNPGVEAWLRQDLPDLARAGARVVVSVWGRTIDEYAEVGRRLARGLADARPEPGARAAAAAPWWPWRPTSAARTSRTASACSRTRPKGRRPRCRRLAEALAPTGLPVWAKLSPNVTDLVAIARAAMASGATRPHPGQHTDGHGHRPLHGAGPPGGRGRRACPARPCTRWPSGPSTSAARRLPGGLHRRGGRRRDRRGRRRTAVRRGRRGPGGHGDLRRPQGAPAGAGGAGGLVRVGGDRAAGPAVGACAPGGAPPGLARPELASVRPSWTGPAATGH